MTAHREPPRNRDGKRLTRLGQVDQRHNNGRHPRENGGKAYATFEVQAFGVSKTPYWVIRREIATGDETVISKHAKMATAEKHAELHRIKQPNRNASKKLKHLLGIA